MGQVEVRSRRVWQRRTYIWVLSGLATISALIYWEQTGLLFILSTVAMCALLIVVAISDLERKNKELIEQAENTNRANNPTRNAAEKQQRGAA